MKKALIGSKLCVSLAAMVIAMFFNGCFMQPAPTAPMQTITFDPKGGTVEPAAITAREGATITLPTPVREGHTFLYWWYPGGWSGRAGEEYRVTPYGNWTAEAYWEKIRMQTITFDPRGGTVEPTSITVREETTITLPTPVREGYTFDGWRYRGSRFTGGDAGDENYFVVSHDDWTAEAYWIKNE